MWRTFNIFDNLVYLPTNRISHFKAYSMIIRTRYERSNSLLAQQIKHDLAVALQDEFNTHKLAVQACGSDDTNATRRSAR